MNISPVNRKAARAQQREQRKRAEAAANGRSPAQPAGSSPSAGQSRSAAAGGLPPGVSQDILEAFFLGRAFAVTLSKRVGEVVVDVVAEISKAAAERPQRIREFQEEVTALARKELEESAAVTLRTPASLPGGGTGADAASAGTDVEALVDDLRAEIAYSRAILMQMKSGGKGGVLPGPPPTAPPTESLPSNNSG